MPVVDEKHLVGIVTSRDYRNVSDISACVSTIMTPRERLVTAKENESLDQVNPQNIWNLHTLILTFI